MAETAETCPVCGETHPTAWICVRRIAGVAQDGEPCDYSQEGQARVEADLDIGVSAS